MDERIGQLRLRMQGRGLHSTRAARRVTPVPRSGAATVRRYPMSKVRSSGCALLEQP